MPRPFEKRLYIASTEHLGTKVGVSGNPELRLPELAKEGAGACVLRYISDFNYDVFTVESALKRRFSARRIKGEYFDVLPDDAIAEALARFAQMDADRQAARREREAASGLKRKMVVIPVAREAELEVILARWMKEKEESDAQTTADPSTQPKL